MVQIKVVYVKNTTGDTLECSLDKLDDVTEMIDGICRYAETYDDLDGGPLAKLLGIESARVTSAPFFPPINIKVQPPPLSHLSDPRKHAV